jgi:hypothetical protein
MAKLDQPFRSDEAYAAALVALASRLGEKQAVATARAVVGRMTRRLQEDYVLARVLTALANRLGEKEAAAAGRVVARRMTQGLPHPYHRHQLAVALAALAGRLPRKEAAALVAPTAHASTQSVAKDARWGDSAGLLTVLAPRMGESEASAAFCVTSEHLPRAKSPAELTNLCQTLSALARQLSPKVTGGVLARGGNALIERLAVETNPATRSNLAAALAVVVGRLDEEKLIGLLQVPLSRGETQALMLDELGRRLGQRFADTRAFEEYVRVNRGHLELRMETAGYH